MTDQPPWPDLASVAHMTRQQLMEELVSTHGKDPQWSQDLSLFEVKIHVTNERTKRKEEPMPTELRDPDVLAGLTPDEMTDNEIRAALMREYGVRGGDLDGLKTKKMIALLNKHRLTKPAPRRGPLLEIIDGVLDYRFDDHAGAGPSGASRWLSCTASLGAGRKFLETLTSEQQALFATSSLAAQEGTIAHTAGEIEALQILGRITPDEAASRLLDLSEPDANGLAYDDEMREFLVQYGDLVQLLAEERGQKNILVECRVAAPIPLSGAHAGQVYAVKGSVDLAGLPTKKHPSLAVCDLKYGLGYDVDAEENPQIRLYGFGLLADLADENGDLPTGLDRIDYYIVQPRLGGVKRWSESVNDLLDWIEGYVSEQLTKALYGEEAGATFEPSDVACQWCPLVGACAADAQYRIERAADLFTAVSDEDAGLSNMDLLTDDRLNSLLDQAYSVDKLLAQLKAEAQRRMESGADLEHFKLVGYQPHRSWEDKAVKVLSEVKKGKIPAEIAEMMWRPRTLVTPASAEKILKSEGVDPKTAKRIMKLIRTPDKRPIIAKASDRRHAWAGVDPVAMFPDLPEGD